MYREGVDALLILWLLCLTPLSPVKEDLDHEARRGKKVTVHEDALSAPCSTCQQYHSHRVEVNKRILRLTLPLVA